MANEAEPYRQCLAHDLSRRCYALWNNCVANTEPPWWMTDQNEWNNFVKQRRRYAWLTEAERVKLEIQLSDNPKMANTNDEALWQARFIDPSRRIHTVTVENDIL